jgi:hypothetical protein
MNSLKQSKENMLKLSEETINQKLLDIEDYKQRIVKLEEDITKEIERMVVETEKLKVSFITKKNRRDEINQIIPLDAVLRTEELNKELLQKETLIKSIDHTTLSVKNNIYIEESKSNRIYKDKIDAINKTMTTLTTRKKQIFATTKLPLDTIEIIDDECMFKDQLTGELLPYTQEHVSYSQSALPIVQLLLELNKDNPLILIGNGAEYDDKSKQALLDIAKKYNGALVADMVIPDSEEELRIVVMKSKQ